MNKKINGIGVILSLVFMLCLIMSCSSEGNGGLTHDEATAISDRVLKVWNEQDFTICEDLYGSNFVRHHPTPSTNGTLADLKNTVSSLHTAFPDARFSFNEMIIRDKRIIVFATLNATNTGLIEGNPATGKEVFMSGVYVYRIDQGKIVEEWTYFNLLSYYQQLGFALIPPQQESN
ncbi:ester cyclase [Acidobacteriota bacterium]